MQPLYPTLSNTVNDTGISLNITPPSFNNSVLFDATNLINVNNLHSGYQYSYNPYNSLYSNLHNQLNICTTNWVKDTVAKQQACIHRAVKDIIEGKGDKIPIIIQTSLNANNGFRINTALLPDKNKHSINNKGDITNHQRAYLNPDHPFYHLINAYYLFDHLAFKQYFSNKGSSPYTQLLLMCDVFIQIREHLELQQEVNGLLSINLLALQDLYWLINALKINSHSREFNKAVSQYKHHTGYTDNIREYTHYLNNLFNQYSRLLIIRLDLGYQQHQITTYDTFRADMDYFIKLIPSNPVFKDLVGYIWKLEYGTDKGYHTHLLLCYDGAKRRSDYHIAKQIGELWQRQITLGRGIYFNCNTKEQKDNYHQCYLGMVHRSEEDKINWMIDYGISYLLKTDEYLRLMKPDNRRILGRGVIKTKNR